MKTRKIGKMLIVFAALALLPVSVWATPIPVLIADDTKAEVAAFGSEPGNGLGDAQVTAWAQSHIAEPLVGPYVMTPSSGGTGTSVTLDCTGYEYVVIHWGGQGGGFVQLFQVTDGTFQFDSPSGYGGFSFARGYNYTAAPVPAGVWLLGTGLAGLLGIRRKMKK